MVNEFVSIKNLSVKFNEIVLEKIFLSIKKGEFVSIVGKSGAGKTTLLNSIGGLVKYSGEIRCPARIGMVFQDHSLLPWLNVEQNIALGLEKTDFTAIRKIVEAIGLTGKEKSYPFELSGGQKQRAAIGRALAIKPQLLLLDEPFANLDTFTKIMMQEWINKLLSKSQITTILVTHDIEEAILLSDRCFVIKNNQFEEEFSIPFLKPRNPSVRYSKEFQQLKQKILQKC
ncbi:MAG: ABC transporter ATP-binding protein [archaeon]